MNLDISIGAALLAGALSFLSPCVLPLVPPYLCFITGASLEQLSEGEAAAAGQRKRTMLAALMFVLGFATVFVLLGASASYAGQLLRSHMGLLAQVAGVFIILMGLNFLGVFKLGFLNREARYHSEVRPAGLIGAYAVGLAFAFGWTPCIGPVLAVILTLAANEQDVARGAGMLAIYSAGLGIPFLLAAMFLARSMTLMNRIKRHMGVIEKAMGVLLLIVGVALVTGAFTSFSFWLLETFPALGALG